MKKILISSLLVLFNLFFFLSVKAEVVSYASTYPLPNIKGVIAEPTFSIMLQEDSNVTLLKTDLEGNQLVSKAVPNITEAAIIKGSDAYFLVGKENNHLVVTVFDEYLRTKNRMETASILPKGDLSLYYYKKEIYVVCLQKKALATPMVYVIGEDYALREVPFSTIEHIKEVMKKDYPLLENSVVKKEEGVAFYEDSTYKEDCTIFVGSINDQGLLTIQREENVVDKQDFYYQKYLSATILNNSILVLAKKEEESALLVFDVEGNKQEEYKIEGNSIYPTITKGQNRIYITTSESVITYTYDTVLQKDKNIYGTITLMGDEKPYEKIRYSIVPNSGYQVKEVVLKNDQGELLEVKEEYFIMPNTNAYLSVLYEETVENPNTADPILLIIFVFFVLLGILIKLYKKWRWLNK